MSKGRRPVALVMGRDPQPLSFLEAQVSSMGVEVRHVPEAEEALAVARECQPFLVVVDGDTSQGRGLCTSLKEDRATASAKVLMLTSGHYSRGMFEHLFSEHRADVCALRPLDAEMLRDRLQDWLEGPDAAVTEPETEVEPEVELEVAI